MASAETTITTAGGGGGGASLELLALTLLVFAFAFVILLTWVNITHTIVLVETAFLGLAFDILTIAVSNEIIYEIIVVIDDPIVRNRS